METHDPATGEPVRASPGPPGVDDWRDALSRRFLIITIPLVALASGVLLRLVGQPLARVALVSTSLGGLALAVWALKVRRLGRRARGMLVVALFMLFGAVGTATLGFLAGPSAAFATAMLAAALLLGRKGVAATGAAFLAIVAVLGWAFASGRLPPPASTDVLASLPLVWARSWALAFLFFVIIGLIVAGVVRQLEEAAEQARREVARREVAERERIETQRAAMEAQKFEVIGQLAAGIAHDFNNALTAINGATELALGELPADSPARPLLEVVQEAGRRSGSLTQQLLAFARKGPVARTRLDVHATLRAALALLSRSLGPKIQLDAKLDAPRATIEGDAALLYNAFLNLGLNARDAMPDGGTLTFATRVETPTPERARTLGLDPGDHLVIDVTDTGHGFTPEVHARLFEPFFTTKPPGKGTGLGLPAVHGTIRTHRGAVTAASTPGHGATFTLHLPLAAEPPRTGVG